jgi:hypothetical protein
MLRKLIIITTLLIPIQAQAQPWPKPTRPLDKQVMAYMNCMGNIVPKQVYTRNIPFRDAVYIGDMTCRKILPDPIDRMAAMGVILEVGLPK